MAVRTSIVGGSGYVGGELLRLLLGELQPTTGTITLGTGLRIAYFDQQRANLDENATVQENITGGGQNVHFNGRPLHAITYLQNFLFTPDQARSPLSHLSGGERNRVHLARMLKKRMRLLANLDRLSP